VNIIYVSSNANHRVTESLTLRLHRINFVYRLEIPIRIQFQRLKLKVNLTLNFV